MDDGKSLVAQSMNLPAIAYRRPGWSGVGKSLEGPDTSSILATESGDEGSSRDYALHGAARNQPGLTAFNFLIHVVSVIIKLIKEAIGKQCPEKFRVEISQGEEGERNTVEEQLGIFCCSSESQCTRDLLPAFLPASLRAFHFCHK